jgi:hypothetical protein
MLSRKVVQNVIYAWYILLSVTSGCDVIKKEMERIVNNNNLLILITTKFIKLHVSAHQKRTIVRQ